MIKIKTVSNIFFCFLILTFIFGRSFMGIYIFGIRLGEIFVLISLLSSFYLILNYKKLSVKFGTLHVVIHILIWLSFLINIIISNSPIFSPYTYKSSSYIWSLSSIYLGYYLFNYIKINKKKNITIQTSLFIVYVLSVVHYPNFIINFFELYSDKWDFNKASSVAILFFIAILLNNKYKYFGRFTFEYFIISSFIFLPFFLYKSRGAFIAIFLFIIFQIIDHKSEIFIFDLRFFGIVLLAVLLGAASTLRVLDQNIGELAEEDKLFSVFYSGEAIKKLSNQKDTKVESFVSFYTRDGRVFSIDGNVNWRIQIWQDVYFDLLDDEKLFLGNGYRDIIPAMEKFERQGRDGLNENVHNFLINILARGGIVHLALFVTLFLNIMFKFNKKNRNVFYLMTGVFIVSFFDASMENAHFPNIFYIFLSYFIIDELAS